MTMRTNTGGCHCGAVRFEAELDLAAGTLKCNCSSCSKARSWLAFVPASRYRLVAGHDVEATYRWTPPGRPGPSVDYHFCPKCGIRTPGRGDMEAMGGAFYAVQIPLLDGIDSDELATAPVQYVDGRHDRLDRPPADTRFL